MTTRERVARAWHEKSDHAADGTEYGGAMCNCWHVAGRIMPMLAGAWAQGYTQGKLDAIMCAPGPTPKPRNPYEGVRHVDQ